MFKPPHSMDRIRSLSCLTLPAILCLGFLLRAYGINFGLPDRYHADEPILINHALAYGSGDLNPHFFRIPPLLSYVMFLIYGLFFVVGKFSGTWQGVHDFEIFFFSDPSMFYLLGRVFLGLIPGTAAIYVLYALVKKYFDRHTALWSAFLFSISYLAVRDSHYAYTDMWLLFVLILSFNPILEIATGRQETRKLHLLAGFMIGLAAAIKYNGIFLVIPYLSAMILNRSKSYFLKNSILAALATIITFLVLNPFALIDSRFFISEMKAEGAAHSGTAFFHHILYSLLESQGIMFLIASLIGFSIPFWAASAKELQRKVWVIGSFVLFYYFVIVLRGQEYDRYVLPLIPFLSIGTAILLNRLSSRTGRQGKFYSVIVAFMICFLPFTQSLLLASIVSRADTRTLSKAWIKENIPPGSRMAIGVPFYMPRLQDSLSILRSRFDKANKETSLNGGQKRRLEFFLNREAKQGKGYNLYYLSQSPEEESSFLFAGPYISYDEAAFKRFGIQYVVLAGSSEVEKWRKLMPNLQETSKRIASFSPYRDKTREREYDKLPLTGLPFTWQELVHRERGGMPIEVFKLDSMG